MTAPDRRDLPFLLNGTDPRATTVQALDHVFETDADLERERQWALRLRAAVRQSALGSPADAGSARLEALLKAERETAATPKPTPARRPQAAGPGWLDTLRAWCTPQFAVACSVVAVQAVVIASLVPGGEDAAEYQRMRSGASSAGSWVQGAVPHLRVMFRDGTSEAALRELLRREGLEIVAGPSAVGEYRLMPRPGVNADLVTLRDRLRADPAVALATDDQGPVRSEH